MLFKISFLTSLLFSAVYPLCFWISAKDPLKNNFHRFHLGTACLVAGVATIVFWFSPEIDLTLKYNLIVWTVLLLLVSAINWTRESPHVLHITLISVWGILVIFKILQSWGIKGTPLEIIIIVLGAMIFCASLFAMNLGHWYLNVHGLPLSHLKRSVNVFWALTALRAAFDLVLICTQHVTLHGEIYSLGQFILTLEGFLLILAILFGTIFPLVCLYFVKGTLDVKSTQSATGILYAILCGVVIGDITYKYYFFKYGIVL
jgi:hypothetical protein